VGGCSSFSRCRQQHIESLPSLRAHRRVAASSDEVLVDDFWAWVSTHHCRQIPPFSCCCLSKCFMRSATATLCILQPPRVVSLSVSIGLPCANNVFFSCTHSVTDSVSQSVTHSLSGKLTFVAHSLRVTTTGHCCRYYHAWLNGILLDDHELGESTQFQARIPYDNVDCTDAARSQHVSNPWPAASVSDVASHSSSNKCAHAQLFALL
jgi:hypothetical protein